MNDSPPTSPGSQTGDSSTSLSQAQVDIRSPPVTEDVPSAVSGPGSGTSSVNLEENYADFLKPNDDSCTAHLDDTFPSAFTHTNSDNMSSDGSSTPLIKVDESNGGENSEEKEEAKEISISQAENNIELETAPFLENTPTHATSRTEPEGNAPQIPQILLEGQDIKKILSVSADQIDSLVVEEIEPSKYPKITNKILNVDESFLHASQSSIHEKGTKDRRASTMQNLHERASFLDLTSASKMGRALSNALIYLKDDITYGSMVALNKQVVKEVEKDNLISESKPLSIVASARYIKNLLAVSFSIVLMFIALGSVRNLQSSINHEDAVGVMSMAVSFTGYMVGSLFSPFLVQMVQPKKCLIVSLIPHFTYVAANIYPNYWLMAIASFAQGVGLAIIWNTMSTYIALLSRGMSQKKNEEYGHVSGKFFGIFGLIYQSYFIVGNLIASLVLTLGDTGLDGVEVSANSSSMTSQNHSDKALSPPNVTPNISSYIGYYQNSSSSFIDNSVMGSQNTSNEDEGHLHLCGANFWQHYDLGGSVFVVSVDTKFVLFGTYMVCVLISMIIAMFFLEPLNPRLFESTVHPMRRLRKHLISLVKFFISPRFLLLLPLLMHSFMQVGFYTVEMTKAFVTCTLGIHMVGWVMMCMGICGSITSYFSGLLVKVIGRLPQLIFAIVLNLIMLLFMAYWAPTDDSMVPYFTLMGIWGVSDGIYVTQINSLLCTVFPTQYEEAFAGLRILQGLGVALVGSYSKALGMLDKIYISGAICMVAMTCYIIMEVLLRREAKKMVTIVRQTSV